MDTDYLSINRAGWQRLTKKGYAWTRPVGPSEMKRARQILDPHGWLPWNSIAKVLCLASGGGQQGPLFAHLGCDVTVLDLSPAQLQQDKHVAMTHDLKINLIEGRMENLESLYNKNFDLVYQPISAVYMPNITKAYLEVAKVLRPNGLYYVSHWNPVCSSDVYRTGGNGRKIERVADSRKDTTTRGTWRRPAMDLLFYRVRAKLEAHATS